MNQCAFSANAILNTDFPVAQFPAGTDPTKAMFVWTPHSVQESLNLYVYATGGLNPGWYLWKPVLESKDLGDTTNYSSVSKVSQVF